MYKAHDCVLSKLWKCFEIQLRCKFSRILFTKYYALGECKWIEPNHGSHWNFLNWRFLSLNMARSILINYSIFVKDIWPEGVKITFRKLFGIVFWIHTRTSFKYFSKRHAHTLLAICTPFSTGTPENTNTSLWLC